MDGRFYFCLRVALAPYGKDAAPGVARDLQCVSVSLFRRLQTCGRSSFLAAVHSMTRTRKFLVERGLQVVRVEVAAARECRRQRVLGTFDTVLHFANSEVPRALNSCRSLAFSGGSGGKLQSVLCCSSQAHQLSVSLGSAGPLESPCTRLERKESLVRWTMRKPNFGLGVFCPGSASARWGAAPFSV